MLIMHVITHLGIIIINYAALLDFLLFAFALRIHSIFMPLMCNTHLNGAIPFEVQSNARCRSDFAEKEDAGVAAVSLGEGRSRGRSLMPDL